MRLVYADPPYLGQCASYGHVHNVGGSLPWDGMCWDHRETHTTLLTWLVTETDGFAYSCNPVNLTWAAHYGRVAAWTKTWRQLRPVATQYSWEPVIFDEARSGERRPMVVDWLACRISMGTGVRGAKPEEFNEWVLDLMGFEPGDTVLDLFPGSGGMGREVERREREAVPS